MAYIIVNVNSCKLQLTAGFHIKGDRPVVGFLRFLRKVTGGEFPGASVIDNTFTADALPRTRIGAIAGFNIFFQ
jgi:hypothetical protein